MPFKLLVVEDDANAAEFVCKGLRQEGFAVEHAAAGPDALHMALSETFDLIVLDRNIPGVDGLSVLKALRAAQNETPVIILSALAHADERVNGLRAGADDYLGKPYTFSELHLRIENLLKRRSGKETQTSLSCGDLAMDLLTRRVTRAGKPIDLLQREFQILEHLLRNKDRVVTRTMLLEQVWDYRFDPHTSLIDTHMSRLRKKIDDAFDSPLLHTIRGVGYRLSEQP
ncbi:MAG: response regulator transcription factor [Hyphomonadaceae bacterium]|nr:response regulator transcription factor [Hyphomonadaceae bacterium]MCA8886420.1 response regulator transcription factor [Hyphomonadaceae bacterium]